jgi:PAS domain S-box-containing protein
MRKQSRNRYSMHTHRMNPKPNFKATAARLRHRAEARLSGRQANLRQKAVVPKTTADNLRLLHELEVHQIELEVQNAELREARDRMEVLLEKYTDLYDFAPVGYFSLDEKGRILEANLTGAALLGVERSLLINRRLTSLVVPANQPLFLAFLERIFAETGRQVCEAPVLREGAGSFWGSFHGAASISVGGPRKLCRVAVSDITSLKQAEEAQRRVNALTIANLEFKREIARREAVEESLKKSEIHQRQLLDQSQQMQEQLRRLSRQVLLAQEEERKRISRELHDVVAQTLTGINVRLAAH